jgi:hypothetical protein
MRGVLYKTQTKDQTFINTETSKQEAARPLQLTLPTSAEAHCLAAVLLATICYRQLDFVTRRGPCVRHFVFFTDEEYIYSQNSSIWSAENPNSMRENPLLLSKSGFSGQ